ncbi:MAG: hypothetical protein WAV89_13175 [Ignavibacteriaceae bacterium]
MESEKELNLKILEITMTIQEKYPELSEYLGEMPVTIPDTENPEINVENLRAYFDSLTSLLENYIREHKLEYVK